jgi:hypothetical protein
MFHAGGLTAYIVTLHPGVLALSAALAAAAALPLLILLLTLKVKHPWVLLCLFVVGTTLVGHVVISRTADLSPVSVETVRIAGDDIRPPH